MLLPQSTVLIIALIQNLRMLVEYQYTAVGLKPAVAIFTYQNYIVILYLIFLCPHTANQRRKICSLTLSLHKRIMFLSI